MDKSGMSVLNRRATVSGITAGFESVPWYSFYLNQLRIEVPKWHL